MSCRKLAKVALALSLAGGSLLSAPTAAAQDATAGSDMTAILTDQLVNAPYDVADVGVGGLDFAGDGQNLLDVGSGLGVLGVGLVPMMGVLTNDYDHIASMMQSSELSRQALEATERARREAEARARAGASARGRVRDIPYADAFNAAAERHNVDARMLAAVAKAESGFRDDIISCATPSSAGALGIMQFMPATARSYGVDPCNPEQAIDGAARMLKGLHERYGNWDLAFAAYNAGVGNVDRYGGIPPFNETQNYVRKVNENWEEYKAMWPTEERVGTGVLAWPADGPVTSGYGMRWGKLHAGIDIGAPMGAPIYAADSGSVTFAGWAGGYGNFVTIDHGNGLVTAYGHQSRIAVSSGTSVQRGDVIGYIGSTGDSTGPHLHFEVREDGTAKDPKGWLG